MAHCFSCGESLDELDGVYRNTVCPHCGKDARVCLNCRFYDPGAHWECRETIPEPVRDKDRANFCGYFQLGDSPGQKKGSASGDPKADKARDNFDKLFGDG